MKLLSVSYARMCGFAGGELDLRAVPGGLVTLAGPNWNGKTTLLELPLAAFYREWASRTNNDIAGWADSRDSWVAAEFSIGGDVYRTKVTIDGTTRKSQALLQVQTATGWRSLTDGKVSTFDAAMAELVPPKSALLSSQFAAQNRAGSLTAASRSQRKDLFIHFLWLERMIAMGETAKTCAEAAASALVALRTAQSTLRESATDDALQVAQQAAMVAVKNLADNQARLDELDLVLAGLDAARVDLFEASERWSAANLQLTTYRQRQAAAMDRLAGIPSAQAKASESSFAAVKKATEKHNRDLAALRKRREGLETLLAEADVIDDAVQELASVTSLLAVARGTLDVAQEKLPSLLLRRAKHQAAAHARASLASVPCGGPSVFPTCQFLADAAQLPATAPEDDERELLATETAVEEAKELIADFEKRIDRIRPIAAKAAALRVTDDRLRDLDEEEAKIARDLKDASNDADMRLGTTLYELNAVRVAAQAEYANCEHDLTPLALIVEQTAHAKHEFAKIEAVIRDTRREHADIMTAVTTARSLVERWSAEIQRLTEQRAKADALTPRIARVERDARVQGFLAKALHRDGLPTLEIAAAAPAISQLTTDLLDHSGFGSRFRVTVTTLVPTADGKGWKEDFAIRVYDNDRGKEIADVGDLSGGERIMVEEALRAALTIYMSARHEHPVKTCWRDETTGPLDKENRPRYIAMLRRLRELGGYDHVLYVSHADDAVAAADTIFDVSMGTATRRA